MTDNPTHQDTPEVKMRQRTYFDGKLRRSGKPTRQSTLRRYLDNIQADWLRNGLFPLTPAGEAGVNNAHTVTRVSEDELVIVTTEGHTLRFIIVGL
jgi:hypothetical protein